MLQPLPKTMKALVFDSGGKHNLKFVSDKPVPTPSPSQVLIRVHAASLNHEYKLLRMPGSKKMFGHVVGWDVAGTVVAVGAKVTCLAVGTAVFGHCNSGAPGVGGSFAEYALTEAHHVVAKPEGVSFEEAATLNVAAVTSLRGMEEAGLKAGDSILIVGGSGGCGTFGIQMAKLLGAGKVVAICGDSNMDLCRDLGADVVCSYSGGEEKLVAELKQHGPFDCAYDTVTSPDDPPYEHITHQVLKPGGLHVAINGKASDFVRAMVSKSLCFSIQRRNFKLFITAADAQTVPQLTRIGAWVADKKLKCVIDSTVPFTEQGMLAGYDKMLARRNKGKVVAIFI